MSASCGILCCSVIKVIKAMVDEFHTWEKYCEVLTVEHPEEEQANLMYRMKCSSIKAIAEVHKVCLADLQVAKRRFNNDTA